MDLAAIRSACFSTPIPSPSRRMLAPSSPVARVSLRRCRRPSDRSFALRRRNRCSACGGAETLVAGTQREEASSHASTKKQRSEAEAADLKSWLHSQGLPPCKVVLKEKAPHPHEGKHRPIHYVAASEDLQAGDVAFSVPNSLIVTLERVLGDETIGNNALFSHTYFTRHFRFFQLEKLYDFKVQVTWQQICFAFFRFFTVLQSIRALLMFV
uniref:Retinoic acid receptor RXR-gamma n=1 Tax=Anthurium amnicola TaxID=1678845 RepID=A0A1D1ZHA4_9ARAE